MDIDLIKTIKIKSSARLAFCLIDMNGERGRVDGCVGVGLLDPTLEIIGRVNSGYGLRIKGTNFKIHHEPLRKLYNDLVKFYPIAKNIDVEIIKTFPEHSGLGFGTQLKMSFAALMNDINNSNYNNIDFAQQVKRGGTSGIGVWSFSKKGLIIDGGHSFGDNKEKKSFIPSSKSTASPPPLIGNFSFPENWRIICVTPILKTRIYGNKEVELFKKHCPVNQLEVNNLCWHILMKLIPSVLEENLNSFNSTITNIQEIAFKRVIWNYQPNEVKLAKRLMIEYGLKGVGLSSLGSTLYSTVKIEDTVSVVDELKNLMLKHGINANVWLTSVK